MKFNKIKLPVLTLIISVMLVPGTVYSDPVRAAEEIRFADSNILLVIYRSIADNEKILYGEYVITKAALLNREKYSSEFNYPDELDTIPEGFITVSYYSGKRSIPELNNMLDAELPAGKTGGLRLAAMWLKKSAEDRYSSEKYHNVIDGIIKKSGLEWQEVFNYYIDSIRSEIKRKIYLNVTDKNMAVLILNDISEPLVKYYTNPSYDEEKKLVDSIISLYKKNHTEGEYLPRIMIQLSDSFSVRIIRKIHDGIE